MTVRGKIDSAITKQVGKWFTVSDLQAKLKVENSTLKPLIMRYARDQILVRRKVKGEARAVQFSPAAKSTKEFEILMANYMPYKTKGKKISAKSNNSSKIVKASSKKSLAVSSKKSMSSKKNVTSKKASSKKASSKKSSKR